MNASSNFEEICEKQFVKKKERKKDRRARAGIKSQSAFVKIMIEM